MLNNNLISIYSSFAEYLLKVIPKIVRRVYILNGEIIVYTNYKDVYKLIFFLRKHSYALFNSLSDICGVDYFNRKWRFEVVYNLLSTIFNARIRVKVKISELGSVPSIVDIFPAANWFERETWDMYGIFFENHPDLRRILTDYGFDGFPLRKDFPLTGYLEVRYSETKKRIVSEPVQLAQEYRSFDFETTWSKESVLNHKY